jgi:hypothetical protein
VQRKYLAVTDKQPAKLERRSFWGFEKLLNIMRGHTIIEILYIIHHPKTIIVFMYHHHKLLDLTTRRIITPHAMKYLQ